MPLFLVIYGLCVVCSQMCRVHLELYFVMTSLSVFLFYLCVLLALVRMHRCFYVDIAHYSSKPAILLGASHISSSLCGLTL